MDVNKNVTEMKEITDAISKIEKLEKLRICPNRQEMIDALKDAKSSAFAEILGLELSQCGEFMPFENFTDYQLYNKLEQYKTGLRLHCIAKCGEKIFNELMKDK